MWDLSQIKSFNGQDPKTTDLIDRATLDRYASCIVAKAAYIGVGAALRNRARLEREENAYREKTRSGR